MTVYTYILVCILFAIICTNNALYQPLRPLPTFNVLPKIITNKNQLYPDGSFEYNTELTDGTRHHATGHLKNVNGDEVLAVKGVYGYLSPEHWNVYVKYEADENGFVVKKLSYGAPVQYHAPNPKVIQSLLAG